MKRTIILDIKGFPCKFKESGWPEHPFKFVTKIVICRKGRYRFNFEFSHLDETKKKPTYIYRLFKIEQI